MKRIFLAYSFRDEDRELARDVERLIASHNFLVKTGDKLGGGNLTAAVKKRIRESHGLVALLTRRDKMAGGGWTTHDWVKDEFKYAKEKEKPAIALVESGVELGGMYQDSERLVLDREALGEALIDLSETLAIWKQETGRTVKIQVLPIKLADKIAAGHGAASCRCGLFAEGEYRVWRDVDPVHEVGGTFLYIQGVDDDDMIQLEVEHGDEKWSSPVTAQWMQIELKKKT